MITIRYFASLREQLQCNREELPWEKEWSTVADIKTHLSKRDSHWLNTLTKNTVLIAVNQQMANEKAPVKDGDEVAFFPPVTGG